MTRITRKTAKLTQRDMTPTPVPGTGAIVVLHGASSDIGQHRILDRPCIIGRGPGCDLALLGGGLSRRHCVVVPTQLGVIVEDLGSTNGTLVNGTPISGPTMLSYGDHIFVGETVIKLASGLELKYYASMDERVGTDELTGLVARHRFEGALQLALDGAVASRVPLSVMMLDMDGTKAINDEFGHLFGAFVIGEAGRIIGNVLALHGMASRLGGDEFAAFLTRCSKAAAVELAGDVVAEVAHHKFVREEIVLHPTISIGVSAFPDDGVTAGELLAKADRSLYVAKENGGNRVER